MVNVAAKLKYLHIAPRKMRTIARLIRGMDVFEARAQLEHLTRRARLPLKKLLNSSVANARHNFGLNEEDLYISSLRVEGGPMVKRMFPRSRGRADIKRKRTSHILVVLSEKEYGKENKS